MLYGDLVTLTPGGVLLGPKAILPIGIFDGSICWGVWVPDASAADQDRSPHLVLSSLHPRYWPFLLRFELKIKDDVGAMAAASKMLSKHHMNVQFGESSPSGHHHATWNVVCEAVEVRKLFEERLQIFRQKKEHWRLREELNSLATELAAAMYGAAYRLRDTMIEEGDFLHPRIVHDDPHLLHRPELIRDELASSLAMEDKQRPIRVRWIQNLPVFAFYGIDTLNPQAFRYDRNRGILRAEDPDRFNKAVRAQKLPDLPARAIASIYPEEHHVRLLPIRSEERLKRMVQIDLAYSAEFTPPGPDADHGEPDTTIGLWADACRRLARRGLNLQRVTNKTLRHDSHAEEGVITLIGIHERVARSFDFEDVQADLKGIARTGTRTISIDNCAISRVTVEKVFISRRMNSDEGDRLLETAVDRARHYGLQPVYVDTRVGEDLRSAITELIRECDAMLQIITLSEDEFSHMQRGGMLDFLPNLHWISFEYGVAQGRRIPVVRIVDRSIFTLDIWKQHIHIGTGDGWAEFNMRRQSELKENFDAAMHRLAGLVRGDPLDD